MMYPVVIRNKKFRFARDQSEDLFFGTSEVSEFIFKLRK